MNQMSKQKFKLFIFLLGILLFMVNCETEDNFESIETIIENTTTTLNTDAEKINFLLVGLKPEIIKYNRNKGIRNLFVKKFGELDGGNSIIIKFPNKDKDFIIVIPFKNNKLNNKKVLIAYYKNGIRKYKFFNTSYEDVSKPFFINNLNLLFRLAYQSNISNRTNCYPQFVGTDFSICVDIFIDSCTGEMYFISNLGKFETCGGELDEVDVDGNTDDDEDDEWDWDDTEGDYDWENNDDQDEDWDWSEEDEQGEGGDVDITNVIFDETLFQTELDEEEILPVFFVNCASFEYYKPPGSPLTAAAVDDMSESFYAIDIKEDGSTRFIKTDVYYNRIYFTLPSWRRNGEAANITAEVVTIAVNTTQAWYALNPSATKHAVSDKLIQFMSAGMLSQGGQFSKVAPFSMQNAGDYQTTLLTSGDCD